MSLKATIQSAVGTAFTAVGDLKKSVTYRRTSGTPSYDPATGQFSATETDYVIDVVEVGKQTVFTNPTLMAQLKVPIDTISNLFVIQRADLTDRPISDDKIISSGTTYPVIDVLEEPSESIWLVAI